MPAHPALLILAAAPWSLPQVSADPLGDLERAKTEARAQAVGTDSLICPKEGDSIIVCARRMGGGVPLPYRAIPGAPTRLVAGEAPSGAAAMSFSECHRLCQQPLKIDVIGAARTVRNLVGRLFD